MPRNYELVLDRFAGLLADRRKQRGVTLDDLADAAGLHRTAIGLIERRERRPSLEVAFRIADALGYSLVDLLREAEGVANTGDRSPKKRSHSWADRLTRVDDKYFRNSKALLQHTGFTVNVLRASLLSFYELVDFIDEQLATKNAPVLALTVELANLSSMTGNMLGASIATCSNGLYKRNRPHAFPDLLALKKPARPLELKVALEKNRPKAHLPKPGTFITFRYVLGNRDGHFQNGKISRGDTVWLWEIKVGKLTAEDYDLSNTEGDSGKTAVIKSEKFNSGMKLVYFVPEFCPYKVGREKPYPGFN